MVRSIAAVGAGYLVFAAGAVALFALSSKHPHAPEDTGFTVLAIAYGALFAAVGGWVTAALARDREVGHALVLAFVIAIGAAISLLAQGEGAIWSQVAALFVMAPSAVLGGVARHRLREH